MSDNRSTPISQINDFSEKWTAEICDQISALRTIYLELSEETYSENDAIDPDFLGYILKFAHFYNCSRAICNKGNELPIPQVPELVPSLAWIRHILFPDQYPHPDTLDDTPAPP